MKVFFVNNGYDGCAYVRTLLPMRFNNWLGDKRDISERPNYERAGRLSTMCDVVVFHRPDEQQRLDAMRMLKRLGKKIVFDNDDTYKVNDAMKLGKFFKSKSSILDDCIKEADLVTTTTEFLADEYRKLNKNVVVLPNQINPDDWPKPLKNTSNKVRVGIFGSTTLNNDSVHIKKTLETLSKDSNVQLVIFGLPPKKSKLITDTYKDEYDFWESLDIEWHPFVEMKDYINKLNSLKLDLVLIPREDSYFNRCKSNLKFLEASMLNIPVIAQGFTDNKSPYQQDITDGLNGFIVIKDNDWLEKTYKLINNKELREKIGSNANKYVLEHYNIKNNYKQWQYAYNQYLK